MADKGRLEKYIQSAEDKGLFLHKLFGMHFTNVWVRQLYSNICDTADLFLVRFIYANVLIARSILLVLGLLVAMAFLGWINISPLEVISILQGSAAWVAYLKKAILFLGWTWGAIIILSVISTTFRNIVMFVVKGVEVAGGVAIWGPWASEVVVEEVSEVVVAKFGGKVLGKIAGFFLSLAPSFQNAGCFYAVDVLHLPKLAHQLNLFSATLMSAEAYLVWIYFLGGTSLFWVIFLVSAAIIWLNFFHVRHKVDEIWENFEKKEKKKAEAEKDGNDEKDDDDEEILTEEQIAEITSPLGLIRVPIIATFSYYFATITFYETNWFWAGFIAIYVIVNSLVWKRLLKPMLFDNTNHPGQG